MWLAMGPGLGLDMGDLSSLELYCKTTWGMNAEDVEKGEDRYVSEAWQFGPMQR